MRLPPSGLLLVATLAFAGDVSAQHAIEQPAIHINAFRVITSVAMPSGHAPPPAYTGGAVTFYVDVGSTDAADRSDVVVRVRSRDGLDTSQTITVPAKGTATVTFHDPNGVGACNPKPYSVFVSSASAGTNDEHGAAITPSCKLTSTLRDPWNLSEPDRVAEAQKGTAYVTNDALVEATCSSGVKIKGQAVNHTKTSAASLIVQAKDPHGAVVSQTVGFSLGAGESKSVELAPADHPHDVPDRLDVAINDWQHALTGHIQNQGIQVLTTRTCTLSAGLAAAERLR